MSDKSHTPDESWADKKIFTTGEAARVCKVSQQTIIRCFDAGRLAGFRVPGSKFRRIPREELIRFMHDNSIPTDLLEGQTRRVLVVDDDPQVLELLVEILSSDGRFVVQTASTGYDAGIMTESFRPHLMILDFLLPDINGNLVCQRLRSNPQYKNTRVICISGVVDEQQVKSLIEAGADHFLKKPFNIRQLTQIMTQLLELPDNNHDA